MTNQDQDNRSSEPLFEMPSGIDVVPEERHLVGSPSEPSASFRPINPNTGQDQQTLPGGTGDLEDGEHLLRGSDPEADVHRTKRGEQRIATHRRRTSDVRSVVRVAATSSGAHFVYALIAFTVAIGVLGLALTWRDGRVLAASAVITPLSLTWFVIRLRAWLNRTPYWYRLLTSLGENADNLAQFRLLRALSRAIRGLYN
ncbi:MAG: hypothetical protein AAGA55_05080 [Planctomycetota bacterium]